MAQSMVYADLKFATAPSLPASTCPSAPDEDDSPYENVPLGPVTVEPSPGKSPAVATTAGVPRVQDGQHVVAVGSQGDAHGCSSLAGRWPRRWRVPARLLAGSLLLLLLLLATVALGACYWQITRSLQETSREHEAERGRLSQEVSAREESLEQTRMELAWARAELQRAWQEGNSSLLDLTALQKEVQEVQGKLINSESTVSSLQACVNTECCPSGWVLYRNVCLFISAEKKNCWQSCEDCKNKGAWLLAQANWPLEKMPVRSRGTAAQQEGG
ncbi:CD72 protein, partial [Thinocorus orbignyianus]|nr:CD72 protein [Thinocorus orbignyianus]